MYLKRLEMLGFKSFATRTVLEFSSGVTAVVGPNGAGKSNVADAIRWVLGEQSMRQLRGKKGEDIIFAGGHGKSAQGMAEVALTLDNSTGWIPSAYSEIMVTRRSYRSGENEYLINKQKVRLRDVVLLLAQARIGADSYTVVGQGLIDAALSLRAEERRALFEDAAGIRPFQVQRLEAEGRLKQTEQNLERLRDIVGEIEPRLDPLREQAQRAVEYRQLDGELREVLLAWYGLQWRRLSMLQTRAATAEQEQAAQVRELEQAIQQADEQGDIQRTQRQSIHSSIAEGRAQSNEANRRVQESERQLAVNVERLAGIERQRGDQQREELRLRERLIVVQQRLVDLEEQCDSADEAVDSEAAALAAFEARAIRAQKDYELDDHRLRASQNDHIQAQARLGASQADLGRQQKHLGERNRALAARRESIAQAQQTLRALDSRLHEERARLESLRGEEQGVTQRKQALARTMADTQQEMERLKVALAEAERLRRALHDRLNILKNWRQNLAGYSDGVRSLLRAPTGKVSGVIGPVPQLGIAPQGFEAALEAALGPYVQAVVVQSEADAQCCLDYLRASKSGRALIVWLEGPLSLNETQLHAQAATLDELLSIDPALKERVFGFAIHHIQCEPLYFALFSRMLQGIVIVKDMGTARELLSLPMTSNVDMVGNVCAPTVEQRRIASNGGQGGDAYLGHIKSLVTLQGEVAHSDGWISGGTQKDGGQQGILAYERELHELPQQLGKQISLLDQLNNQISELQRAQEGRRAEQAAIDKELQKLAAHTHELNRTLANTQREQERAQAEAQLAASVEQQMASELAGLEQEQLAAQERVRAHEKTQHELAGLVEELQQHVEEQSLAYRRLQDELGRMRTSLAVKRQEAKSLRQQTATQQTLAQELQTQVGQQVARNKEATDQQQRLQTTIAQQRQELERSQATAHAALEGLRTVEARAGEVDAEITALEKQVAQLHAGLSLAEREYRRCLLESQKAQDAVTALLEQLQEEMGDMDPQQLTMGMPQLAPATTSPQSGEIGEERLPGTDQWLPQSPLLAPLEWSGVNAATTTGDSSLAAVAAELSEAEEAQLRKLRRRVETLRGRLKTLGGCDPDAPRQYEETRTRYEFLTTQITDMTQAAQHLRSIISQLDVTMARQFETTFQTVNARFREYFTTLFNGGSARLELVAAKESEDMGAVPSSMAAGVEVIVQPPGKKVQDLSLLSGGERALVSAALLFSLLETNPPPFCLLDEVDAALDESNVTRFSDILKKLAQRIQFIVITHNRVTMTVSQVIYGISMGGDSVSRLLSMKLEEAPVAGDR